MKKVIKSKKKFVEAWCLGGGSAREKEMIRTGRIRLHQDGSYEIFSRESGSCGEIAHRGDYFKVDGGGFPYPNDRRFFEANHRRIDAGLYEQLPRPLEAWFTDEPVPAEVRFLEAHKGLTLDFDARVPSMRCTLFGADMCVPLQNYVLMFYRIDRNDSGEILDADFNFVEKSEFDRTYRILEDA